MIMRTSSATKRSGHRRTISSTTILFSVTVPVLSTHRVSTRARVSMQSNWRHIVFFRARRITPATRARLVRRYSPSGIMPTKAPTVDVTPAVRSLPSQRTSLTISSAPMGRITMPIHLTRSLRERIMPRSFGFFWRLASSVRRLTKEFSPTAVSRARHSPDTRKLPESSSEPGVFLISSASPVTRASLTRHSPVRTSASAHTWSPAEKTTTSSRTNRSTVVSVSSPPRITAAFGELSIFSSSSAFLLRSSCTMPIAALMTTTPMNRILVICECTAIIAAASNTKIALK